MVRCVSGWDALTSHLPFTENWVMMKFFVIIIGTYNNGAIWAIRSHLNHHYLDCLFNSFWRLAVGQHQHQNSPLSALCEGNPQITGPVMQKAIRADSRIMPNQWETALLCNDVSHWLGANLESAPVFPCYNIIIYLEHHIRWKPYYGLMWSPFIPFLIIPSAYTMRANKALSYEPGGLIYYAISKHTC